MATFRSANLAVAVFAVALLLSSSMCLADDNIAQPVTIASLIREQTDISRLPLLHDWTSNLQSSYDRTGGNADSGNFLSVTGDDGVMADMDGPGAIVRMWSANPGGQVKIYIDGSTTPVIDTTFHQLFDGSFPPFLLGLSNNATGGNYSYLPIPYAHHCKVVLEGAKVYYQVNYLTFAPGTDVNSFSLPLAATDQIAVDGANASWLGDIGPPVIKSPTNSVRVEPHQTATLKSESGAGIVTQLSLRAPGVSDADLRLLVLRAYFDGHTAPDIQVPVADFFGNALGRKPYETMVMGCSPDGTLTTSFPMPFGKSARFTIENGSAKRADITFAINVASAPFDPAQQGYFHAFWSQETTQRGVPHVWAHVAGQRGRFVGIVEAMTSRNGIGYLEGDEQFRVDSQTWIPAQVKSTVIAPWNGTGTEDCFNSGWYFDRGEFGIPNTAMLGKDDYQGTIDCLRWFLSDAPTFQQSLDAQIEHGGQNDAPGAYYSSVSYWYSDGPVQPWFNIPPADTLAWRNSRSAELVLNGAIEGESLVRSAVVTGGKVEDQDMRQYDSQWSKGRQLCWSGSTLGDTMTLSLKSPTPGTFDLYGYFTRASDYGTVFFKLNGTPLTTVFDGYAPIVVASGPVLLGTVTVPAGTSSFVVTTAGKNSLSHGNSFGLDALSLLPSGTKPLNMTIQLHGGAY